MVYTFLFILGFVSLGFQIILLRECLVIFSGNELVIGIFLANWMVVVGAGSYIAGTFVNRISPPRRIDKLFNLLTFLAGIIMPVEIFFIRFIRQFLQKAPTEMLGILPVLLFTFIAVLFVCFLFGVWFAFAAKIFLRNSEPEENVAGRLYAVETFGAVLGGLIVSIIFIKYFNAFQISLLFSLLIFVALAIFNLLHAPPDKSGGCILKKYYIFAILAIILLLKSGTIEKYSLSYSWKPFNLAESKESIYGRISAVENENEYDFYENSNRVYSTVSSAANEEITHIPLLLSKGCKNVLLLGGGGNNIYEVMKHPLEKLTYVEPNAVLMEFLKKYSNEKIKKTLNAATIKIIGSDGRFFVKNTAEKFDCVIVDVLPPMTGMDNRYFTYEFFNEVKDILTPAGILIFPVMSSENYMSGELKLLSASIRKTAGKIFDYCRVVPASNNYFICSGIDFDIKPDILIKRIEKKRIKTEYLTAHYLKYILRADRVKRINGWVTEKKDIASINSDFYPICYFYGLNYWISYFGKTLPENMLSFAVSWKFAAILVFIYIGLISFFVKIKKFILQTIIIAVSCASVILELLIIFTFQSVYGYVYYKIGILLSLCFLGIGIGSYMADRILVNPPTNSPTIGGGVKKQNTVAIIKTTMFCMVLFSCMLPFIFRFSARGCVPGGFVEPLFYILVSLAGFFVGIIFPLVIKNYSDMQERKIGKFYGLDLAGAMLGSVSATLIFMPLFGIGNTCFLTAFFVFLLIFFIK